MSHKQMEVAVVYHFFAHYRKAVVDELMESSRHHYSFVGDKKDPESSGIAACSFGDPSRFLYAPCYMLPGGFLYQRGLIRLAASSRFKTIIYLGDVQFVSTWISALLARVWGKRVLFWTHGWLRNEKGIKSWVRCSFYRLAHGLLLYGERAKGFGIAKGFESSNLYVIYNSLDSKKQQEIRSRITAEHILETRETLFGHWDRPVVICSGRLMEKRRLDLLLEAVWLLKKRDHIVDVLLVGDGPLRKQLEMTARLKGLSVVFYGACYDEEVLARLVMSANATVMPGAVGLTAMQSLVYGTPVITHDDPNEQMPEWEAIRNGVNGQLFRKGDPVDLAAAIEVWTKNNLPDEEARKECFRSVDRYYTPSYQVQVIDAAVAGMSADEVSLSNPSGQ